MFVLYSIEDKIIVLPHELKTANKTNTKDTKDTKDINNTTKDSKETKDKPETKNFLSHKIKTKYIGKVFNSKGIVSSTKNINIKNNVIVELEGVISVDYSIDLIVFSPSENDFLFGRIVKSTNEGILVDCNLLYVKIYAKDLPENTAFDEAEKIWYWKFSNNNCIGNGDCYENGNENNTNSLYYDLNEEVKLKVTNTRYKSTQELRELESNKAEMENVYFSVNDVVEVYGSFKQERIRTC